MHRMNRSLLVRVTAVVLTIALAVVILSQSVFAQTTYVITDGDQVTYYTSFATDPAEVLTEAGFELGEDDTYTTQESSDGVAAINVQRKLPVTINDGGKTITAEALDENVAGLLSRLGIRVDEDDMVSHDMEDKVSGGMEITVTYHETVTETYTEAVPFEIRELSDNRLAKGERQILAEGADGEQLCTAQVTYVNGVEVNRTVLTTEVTQPAKEEMVAVGTADESQDITGELYIGDGVIVLEDGEVLTYDKTMDVVATAYSHYDAGCDMTTSTGTTVHWGTVAVDPRMIPYGTKMFIVTSSGDFVYGVSAAEDCGGSIKGNRVDLYMPTKSQCFSFGKRNCTIYFLT